MTYSVDFAMFLMEGRPATAHDNQIGRPGEIGSTDYIKAEAERLHCDVREFELEAQFRCAGSDAFISWVNNTLGIQRTPHVMWNQADVRKWLKKNWIDEYSGKEYESQQRDGTAIGKLPGSKRTVKF